VLDISLSDFEIDFLEDLKIKKLKIEKFGNTILNFKLRFYFLPDKMPVNISRNFYKFI